VLHSERFQDKAPLQVYATLLDEGKYLCSPRTMYRMIFSRYVVGWKVAHRESKALAKSLIGASYHKQQIVPGQLTIHADRGSSMKSKVVAQLLDDLGVTKTHSRPHVSNDNPYSEAQLKTLKYCPQLPERFGSIQDSRCFCQPSSPGITGSTTTVA